MSSLAALAGHGGSGAFRADSRFALPGATIASAIAVPADPLAGAQAEGYARGLAEARTEAAAALAAEAEARAALDFSFVRLDAEMAEALRQRLEDTVLALCEATLVAYAHDPEVLGTRVERAVAMLARADDERVIRLNPDDLKLVSPRLPSDWRVLADALLPRGALRIETENGGVEDGPAQWRAALAEAFSQC